MIIQFALTHLVDRKPESIIEHVKSDTLEENVSIEQKNFSEVLIPNLIVKQENFENNELNKMNFKDEDCEAKRLKIEKRKRKCSVPGCCFEGIY